MKKIAHQFGSLDAKMRLLGCGACLSPEYHDDSWGAWFNWMGRGFQHAAAVVHKLPQTVLPSMSDSPAENTAEKSEVKVLAKKSNDELLIERNKRLYDALKNVIDSVHRYMRPVPEECLRDPNEVLANTRKLIASIEQAKWNDKGEHYTNYYQHPVEKYVGTEEHRRQVILTEKKNEFEKLQYLQQIIGKRLLVLKQEMSELSTKSRIVTKK